MIDGIQRLGFIGLGVMGGPMAGHLASAGHSVSVYDIDPRAVERLTGAHPGIRSMSRPRDVAEASDIVITMLPSGREVRDTVLGAGGLIEGFKAGSLLLDTSSAEPWYTKEVSSALQTVGVSVVDAPVSGAEAGAIAAKLVFMVGGDAASVSRVRPLLETMGTRVFHLGPVGSGHVMKSINNLITAVTFMATAEGLIAGTGYGLDPQVMTRVLNESTGMSWITRTHIEQRIISRRFDDPFKFELMLKDMNIALEVARQLHLALPLSESARLEWQAIQPELPKGGSVSELVRAMETRAGVELAAKNVTEESKCD
jgi:3-hydroxyisobutyrate dehydrogenase